MKKVCQQVRRTVRQFLWGDRESVSNESLDFAQEHAKHCPACQKWLDEQKCKFAEENRFIEALLYKK